MPLRVVVTGAGGFAGKFIAHHLAGRGFAVTAVARNLPESLLPDAGGPVWRRADLRAPDALPERFDALIHCAAEIPARCQDPDELYRRNMDMARSVFGRAQDAGARSIVFLSSMSVYGAISTPVVTEDTAPQDPDPYGRAKGDAEQLLEAHVKAGLPSGLSIRLPGTVGRGSHNNFLSNALRQVLSGETVAANNPEAPFNNIVYVGDLAAFLGSWIEAPRDGYAVTNLAAADPMTIRDVVSLLFSCAGRPPKVRFGESGKKPFLISLDRAMSLGYRPASVRDSLANFVRDSLGG